MKIVFAKNTQQLEVQICELPISNIAWGTCGCCTDAKSNEMVLGELKSAIAEQESIMQTQDQVLQGREDLIRDTRLGQFSHTNTALGTEITLALV